MPPHPPVSTLGELKSAVARGEIRRRAVKEEVRENLSQRLRRREPLFPGIIGYDETVVPQLVNAILARHHFILLGLRGQAKTRILRALTALLDEWLPIVAESDIHDDPFAPLSAAAQARVAADGDGTPIAWLHREDRYVEKLATPDVTIADMIGDIDPIKAARSGLQLGSAAAMHFGLVPRANRGIFASSRRTRRPHFWRVAARYFRQVTDSGVAANPALSRRLLRRAIPALGAGPDHPPARGCVRGLLAGSTASFSSPWMRGGEPLRQHLHPPAHELDVPLRPVPGSGGDQGLPGELRMHSGGPDIAGMIPRSARSRRRTRRSSCAAPLRPTSCGGWWMRSIPRGLYIYVMVESVAEAETLKPVVGM